jgi:hypothetical protein
VSVTRARARDTVPRRQELAMTLPTVTELPRRLEPVSKDTFIDGLDTTSPPSGGDELHHPTNERQ